jgi:hypothetical protein
VLNRDQSTSIFNPEKWNDDSLVVDPWKRTVYTKQEFLLVNSPANFYGLNDRIQGETEIIVQHNESVISFLLFEGLELKEEETILSSLDSPQLPTLYCLKSISLNSSLAVNLIAALSLETPCVFSMSEIRLIIQDRNMFILSSTSS